MGSRVRRDGRWVGSVRAEENGPRGPRSEQDRRWHYLPLIKTQARLLLRVVVEEVLEDDVKLLPGVVVAVEAPEKPQIRTSQRAESTPITTFWAYQAARYRPRVSPSPRLPVSPSPSRRVHSVPYWGHGVGGRERSNVGQIDVEVIYPRQLRYSGVPLAPLFFSHHVIWYGSHLPVSTARRGRWLSMG